MTDGDCGCLIREQSFLCLSFCGTQLLFSATSIFLICPFFAQYFLEISSLLYWKSNRCHQFFLYRVSFKAFRYNRMQGGSRVGEQSETGWVSVQVGIAQNLAGKLLEYQTGFFPGPSHWLPSNGAHSLEGFSCCANGFAVEGSLSQSVSNLYLPQSGSKYKVSKPSL